MNGFRCYRTADRGGGALTHVQCDIPRVSRYDPDSAESRIFKFSFRIFINPLSTEGFVEFGNAQIHNSNVCELKCLSLHIHIQVIYQIKDWNSYYNIVFEY